MTSVYLTHADVVLPDRVLRDSALLIDDGLITAIEPSAGSVPANARVMDLRGQMLLPGLIDVHSDAIEKEAEPRSGVLFPLDFAVAQVDRRNAAAGITTPFHALSFASSQAGVRCNETAAEIARMVAAWRGHGLVDNRIHCRYEVTDEAAMPVLEALIRDGMVDLVSIMDHSPGQGQFKTLDAYVTYQMRNNGLSREQAGRAVEDKLAGQRGASARIERLLALAREFGIPTASHDDDSPTRIAAVAALGVAMSEFPINVETARAAAEQHLPAIVGAPNVLRGQSQSGSMRAVDGIRDGGAAILCSDYQPSTLIAAAFRVAQQLEMPLPAAIALVTANPAKACGLADRGRLAPGLRADMIAVATIAGQPLVTQTWCAGELVFSTGYRAAGAAGAAGSTPSRQAGTPASEPANEAANEAIRADNGTA